MSIFASMPTRFLVPAVLFFGLVLAAGATDERGKAARVVVVVWDGMRPDLVTDKNAPTLSALARSGVDAGGNLDVERVGGPVAAPYAQAGYVVAFAALRLPLGRVS